jgi:hypothetical protein
MTKEDVIKELQNVLEHTSNGEVCRIIRRVMTSLGK